MQEIEIDLKSKGIKLMSSNPKGNDKPVIGITIGDINGIGPEVIIKALQDQRVLKHFIPVIYGSTKVVSYYRKALNINDFNYAQQKKQGIVPNKINVVNCWDDLIEINVGEETPEGGTAARLAIEKSVEALNNNGIDAIVTAPISKNNIQSETFNFPGHTEFYTKSFKAEDSLMFLVSGGLRVGLATGHIPVSKISEQLTTKGIRRKLKLMLESLKKDFGINKPKIAVLGLNPHAGENGLLGNEELNVIRPAVEKLKNEGHLIFGPFPADGFFGKGDYKKFDGILAMYHDQGLIPFKTIAFESGVNFTAGLPIIRTSPDHGTAFDIAGKNMANPQSMIEAIFLAYDIIKNRKE